MTTGVHEAWADPDPHRRGWLGRYQTDKGVKTVAGRKFRRAALIFGSPQEAVVAAQKALIAHLVAHPRPRSSGAKTFAIHKNGRQVLTLAIGSS